MIQVSQSGPKEQETSKSIEYARNYKTSISPTRTVTLRLRNLGSCFNITTWPGTAGWPWESSHYLSRPLSPHVSYEGLGVDGF